MKKIGFLSLILAYILVLGLSITHAVDTSSTLYTLIDGQKTYVVNYFNQASDNVYDKYNKLGKPVVETIVYKSLVCLGAITNPFDISDIDIARNNLRKDMLEDYISLDAKIKRYDLGLLSDFTGIKNEIIAFSGKYIPLINQFQNNQLQSISGLIQSVRDYTNQNTQLINTISNNINKIEDVKNGYETLTQKINILQNGSSSGQSDFIKSLYKTRDISLNILNSNIAGLQDKFLKRYKKLTGLNLLLSDYKNNLLNSFFQDSELQINSLFSGYYNYTQFAQIKTDVLNMKKDFYTGSNLICSNILSKYNSATENNLLNTKSRINSLISGLNNSISSISSGGLSDSFKQSSNQSIRNFYSKRLNSDLQLFRTYTYQKIDLLFNNLINIPVNNSNTGNIISIPSFTLPQGFSFTKPFNLNEKSDSVKILQQLLTNLGLYSGPISGIYDSVTKNAVYQLQLKNGLLIGYENKTSTRGWMGPATRNLINKLIAQ